MKLKFVLVALLILINGWNIGYEQGMKVGYTNAELVLAYMPESPRLERSLQEFQKSLAQTIQIKQNYAQSKYNEYLHLKETNLLSLEED